MCHSRSQWRPGGRGISRGFAQVTRLNAPTPTGTVGTEWNPDLNLVLKLHHLMKLAVKKRFFST